MLHLPSFINASALYSIIKCSHCQSGNTVHTIFTCFIVTAGLQSFSSSRSDKQTVPDGYTLGWKIGGSNLPIDTEYNNKKKTLKKFLVCMRSKDWPFERV